MVNSSGAKGHMYPIQSTANAEFYVSDMGVPL
jgi:hypothetical protein